jgi:hypothetical protein
MTWRELMPGPARVAHRIRPSGAHGRTASGTLRERRAGPPQQRYAVTAGSFDITASA